MLQNSFPEKLFCRTPISGGLCILKLALEVATKRVQ